MHIDVFVLEGIDRHTLFYAIVFETIKSKARIYGGISMKKEIDKTYERFRNCLILSIWYEEFCILGWSNSSGSYYYTILSDKFQRGKSCMGWDGVSSEFHHLLISYQMPRPYKYPTNL